MTTVRCEDTRGLKHNIGGKIRGGKIVAFQVYRRRNYKYEENNVTCSLGYVFRMYYIVGEKGWGMDLGFAAVLLG